MYLRVISGPAVISRFSHRLISSVFLQCWGKRSVNFICQIVVIWLCCAVLHTRCSVVFSALSLTAQRAFLRLISYCTENTLVVQLFLRLYLLLCREHIRCSTVSSALSLTVQRAHYTLNCFFDFISYCAESTLHAQLFLLPELIPHRLHGPYDNHENGGVTCVSKHSMG